MSLSEKLARGVLRDEDDGTNQSGGGTGEADDAVQPGPGETTDSVADLNAKKDEDKGNDISDDKTDAKADAKADDEGDEDEPKGIPKSRLDSALARAREAEAENRRLRAEQAKQPATEPATKDDTDDDTLTIAQAEKRVADLDIEIAKAMKDEDDDGAKLATLLREQRELSEGIRDARLEDQNAAQRQLTSEEIQFDRVVTALEEQIPSYDPNHDDYNEDLVQETIVLAQALNKQGRNQADSMLLAVDYMSGKLGLKKEDVEAVKKETDVAKNAELQKRLPPDLVGATGMASDKGGVTPDHGNVAGMSQDEFAALSNDEERLKQLRGDFL